MAAKVAKMVDHTSPPYGFQWEKMMLEGEIKRRDRVVKAACRLVYSHIGTREEKLRELRSAVREFERDEKGLLVG